MKNIVKEKKKLNPDVDEKINALEKKIESLKMKAKAAEQKRLNGERIKLHNLVTSFAAQGWPEDYEVLKLNIKSIIEE
jgi:restriction endonuclease S subunit